MLAALVLVGAGCGGSEQPKRLSKDEYAAALKNAIRDSNREGQKAMDELEAGKSGAVDDLKASMRGLHDRLEDIRPPVDAERQHKRLVTASEELADEFGAAVDKREPKTVASLKPLTNMTRYPGGMKILRITAELDAKGYDFG